MSRVSDSEHSYGGSKMANYHVSTSKLIIAFAKALKNRAGDEYITVTGYNHLAHIVYSAADDAMAELDETEEMEL